LSASDKRVCLLGKNICFSKLILNVLRSKKEICHGVTNIAKNMQIVVMSATAALIKMNAFSSTIHKKEIYFPFTELEFTVLPAE
jgi:hypothetical protein